MLLILRCLFDENIDMSHVNIIMLHTDIIYLECRGFNYINTIVLKMTQEDSPLEFLETDTNLYFEEYTVSNLNQEF